MGEIMEGLHQIISSVKKDELPESEIIKVYKKSLFKEKNTSIIMIKAENEKYLLAVGNDHLFQDIKGEEYGNDAKLCPLTHENRLVLNQYFEFTKPRAFGQNETTIGLGDRLGLATPGHVEAVRTSKMRPIFAQQSIRELDLTNRKMEDVIDSAAYSVIQAGYTDGYGADGDHLKEESDIKHELELGISMLTLDCSDYIRNDVDLDNHDEVEAAYQPFNQEIKQYYEDKYLGKSYQIEHNDLVFDKHELMKVVVVYHKAIEYMVYIYKTYIEPLDRDIDFEISIDETMTITTPFDHFFVSKELYDQDVQVTSLAPRFCGEFQKGIDYIGDIAQFEQELEVHAYIADYFKYKLSIHSGSDKFSVFPLISEKTHKRFHLKTAGTNWLEAVRLIAIHEPNLYRNIHQYALDHFAITQKYYHITPNIEDIKPIEQLTETQYQSYLEDDNARQLLHVSYGLLLTVKNDNGHYIFKDDIYAVLVKYEDEYAELLKNHIGKHLELLNFNSK